MIPRTYKTEAIVIKRFNLGEADKLITLMSPQLGKVRGIAKGVRRLYSRKAPSLELFSQVQVFLAKGKNLDFITEVELIQGFPKLRQDLERVKFAYQFAELIDVVTRENQENRAVFELLVKALGWLERTDDLKKEGLRRFQVALLNQLGFGLPQKQDVDTLTGFIESIIDRKLVTEKHLDTNQFSVKMRPSR